MPGLDAVMPDLRCPVCAAPLARTDATVRCTHGHAFDIARQGYLNLAVGTRGSGTGDTSEMVAARDRFLTGGSFAAVRVAVVDAAIRDAAIGDARDSPTSGLVVDLGGGTGYYLAGVLDAAPDAVGLCMDRSVSMLRRAARVHPRAAAIGCDVWQSLPLRDARATVMLNVFAPRNAAEIERVLRPGGLVVVVTPTDRHLHEIRAPLGLLDVQPDKGVRRDETFVRLDRLGVEAVEYPVDLDHASLVDLALMGPAARHTSADQLAGRVRALPDPMTVTVSVEVARYQLR